MVTTVGHWAADKALNPPNWPWNTLAQPGLNDLLNDLGCLGDYRLLLFLAGLMSLIVSFKKWIP